MNLPMRARILCSAVMIISSSVPFGGVAAQVRLDGERVDWEQFRWSDEESTPGGVTWYRDRSESGTPAPSLGLGIGALVGAGTGLLYGAHIYEGGGPGLGAVFGLGLGALSAGAVLVADQSVEMNWWRGLLVGGVVGSVLTFLSDEHMGFSEHEAAHFRWLMPLPAMAMGEWLSRQRDP